MLDHFKSRPIAHFALILSLAMILIPQHGSHAQERDQRTPLVLLAAIDGPIGAGTVRHVEKMIETAIDQDAEALVLRLNTPGGLASSMREIITLILGSPVPIIGYVAPPGAHAASAGTYILYATHVAAMAPGTNLGAATPVQIGGLPSLPSGSDDEPDKNGEKTDQPPGDTMTAKAVNDAVAFIRSLAEMHGRNAEWAEKAVREADSLPAKEAFDIGVIDVVASDIDALLAMIHGRTVIAGSAERALRTDGAKVETLEPDFVSRVLAVLSDPNIALILLLVGIYGLIFEFANPGSIGPGVVGVICLVLGLYALNQLPLNYAGLALVLLGLAFMVAEAVTPTFGVLGIGGIIAFIIGAGMLVDTETPAFQLSWWTIGSLAAVSGGTLILLLGYLLRDYRRRTEFGGLVGNEAMVLDWSGGDGHVWAHGERWLAKSDASFEKGQPVRVLKQDGLTLVVDRMDTSNQPEQQQKGS